MPKIKYSTGAASGYTEDYTGSVQEYKEDYKGPCLQ